MARSNIIDLTVMYQHHTEGAVCVNGEHDTEKDIWLPLAQIEWANNDPVRGDLIEITLPQRLAEDKGLV